MAVTRKKKEDSLNQLISELSNAKGVVFSEYRGMTVKEMDKVRKSLKKDKVAYKVYKITLIKKALEKLGIDFSGLMYTGPVAVAIASDEETAAARSIKLLTKDNKNLVIDGGLFDNKLIPATEVERLATLPSKPQLLSQLLSVLTGAQRGFVTVLSGNIRGLVTVLDAMSKK